MPDVLYDTVVEVPERLVLSEGGPIEGLTGERLAVERPLDEAALRAGDGGDLAKEIAMLERAVHKHGLIFVTSAGNNGPALTKGGAPGTSDMAIAVGAFASAQMMGPQYSLRAKLAVAQDLAGAVANDAVCFKERWTFPFSMSLIRSALKLPRTESSTASTSSTTATSRMKMPSPC